MLSCKHCGGRMEGDGYSVVLHCEYVEDTDGYEPDANPLYCNFEEDESCEEN